MIIVGFFLPMALSFLVWLALAAMAFWVWTGTKATSTLLTMIGGATLALFGLFTGFGIINSFDTFWMVVAGSALVSLGYYYTVKPIVDAHVRDLTADLKAKATAKAAHPSATASPASAMPAPTSATVSPASAAKSPTLSR
jgi:hypothetical protein